jgi:hypothetical protein
LGPHKKKININKNKNCWKKTKKIYNNEKSTQERSENGQRLVEEVQKYKN